MPPTRCRPRSKIGPRGLGDNRNPGPLANTCSATVRRVELPIPELVENRLRSVAMLAPGAPALDREQAPELLEQLEAALLECGTAGPGRGAV